MHSPMLRSGSLVAFARSGAFLAALSLPLSAQEDPGTSYHLRIVDPVSAALRAHLEDHYDVLHSPAAGACEVIVWPGEYAEFQRLGLATQLIARGRPYRDIVAAQQQERQQQQLAPDAQYFTPAEIVAAIDARVAAYPTLARKVDLTTLPGAAQTHGNRSIYALKISDQVALDEDEPAVLLAAQHHARELTTPLMVFEAVDRLLTGYASDPALRAVVDGYELYCVPCVNPDGVDTVWTTDNYWRKNRRNNGGGRYGVDLNRNYPFLFGRCGSSSNTGSDLYRGPAPGSEPEVQTMIALGRLLRPEIYLDFHSSGREVLFLYAPCATVAPSVKGLIDHYVGRLRTPMTYATRDPSGSGEAPEWHWADGGALSFLTEVNTSFQPSYTTGTSEAVRVWPGVREALTAWRPAVRGHVRSIFKNQPVAATIGIAPSPFAHGEQSASRGRDGRYCLWLPLGSWDVTWSAPGFDPVMKRVQVVAYDSPQTVEVLLVPSAPRASLVKFGSDRIGTTTTLTYTSLPDAGERYWVLLALGTTPGIDAGAGRTFPLNPDGLFFESLIGVLLSGNGRLSSSGQALVGLPIPGLSGLIGVRLFAAGLTENGDYLHSLKNYSGAVEVVIRP